MLYLLKLLLLILQIYYTKGNIFKDWYIERRSEDGRPEQLYDCKQLPIVCAQKDCRPLAKESKSLPTESIFNNDNQPKIQITPNQYKDAKLLCIDSNFMYVRTEITTGIIEHGGSLDFVVTYLYNTYKRKKKKRQKH